MKERERDESREKMRDTMLEKEGLKKKDRELE